VDRDDPEITATALREAAFYGRLEVLKKSGINPEVDDVIDLLDAAAFSRKPEVVEYLLTFNPDVNALTKDGDTVIDSYFQSLGWDLGSIFMQRDPRPTIQSIELLAKRGAGGNRRNDIVTANCAKHCARRTGGRRLIF